MCRSKHKNRGWVLKSNTTKAQGAETGQAFAEPIPSLEDD